jgi:hypothetical protein
MVVTPASKLMEWIERRISSGERDGKLPLVHENGVGETLSDVPTFHLQVITTCR